MPKSREENAHETGEIDLPEEVGSEKHVYEELKEGIWLEASSGSVAKEDKE